LSQLIGISRAKELIFLGDSISAQRSENIGLVNEVCDDDPYSRALDIALKISQNGNLLKII
jgi:enoyl-CoA hydratase